MKGRYTRMGWVVFVVVGCGVVFAVLTYDEKSWTGNSTPTRPTPPKPKYGKCVCGGDWVPRDGRRGPFLGCSNFPAGKCQRTRDYRANEW